MKLLKQCLPLLILLGIGSGAMANNVKFYEGDLDAARALAAKEGKMIFVDFYAKWCMPCKWMDQTTFTDSQVGQIMNDDYISVKINIDDLEGFNLSQKYEIQVLPTMLIFNNDGQMVDRVEETMPPSKLINLLDKHTMGKGSKADVTHNVNRSPKTAVHTSRSSDHETDVTRTKETKSSYKLQMGAFTQYENAVAKVAQLQDLFLEPIVVVNEVENDQVTFKIMMGHFASRSEAESFKKILLDDFKMNSIVF